MPESPQKRPDKPLTPRYAWQPFTPRGVAAFAHASLTRLVLVQLIVAAVVAATLIWCLCIAWIPVITEAIQRLPSNGFVRRGHLNFEGESPMRLAENSRLGLVVDLAATSSAGRVADLEIAFEKDRVVLHGPLGDWWQLYDPHYLISFNRSELEPAWGAWRRPILFGIAIATITSLFIMWWSLALIYLPLVKLIAFFADRTVNWRSAWRMTAASLLPGACIVALALALYGFGAIDFFRFGLLYLLHVLAGLAFAVTSPLFLPKLPRAPLGKNPFAAPAQSTEPGETTNPFGGPDRS